MNSEAIERFLTVIVLGLGTVVLLVGPSLTAFLVVTGPSSGWRARQRHLLCVLAIAIRRSQTLPAVLDGYIESVHGVHSFSLLPPLGRSRFRVQLRGLSDRLRDGRSLSAALAELPGLLPRPVVAAIRIGEETGCLAEVLEEAAGGQVESTRVAESNLEVFSVFFYGVMVLVAIGIFLTFQLLWIMPSLKMIYRDFGLELPRLTVDVLPGLLIVPLLAVTVAFTVPCFLLALRVVGWFPGRESLRVSRLTHWWSRSRAVEILRTLSLSLRAGTGLHHAIEVQIEVAGNKDVEQRLRRVRETIAVGGNGWEAMQQERILTARERDVLDSAQRLGNLPWALAALAETCERQTNRRVPWLLQVIRPVMIIFLGAIVGTYAIACFMPLIKMLNELS